MKKNMAGAILGLLAFMSGCAAPRTVDPQAKAGGPTNTSVRCTASPCRVAITVAAGCHVTVEPFELVIPASLGPNVEVEWTLTTNDGWTFDPEGIRVVPPNQHFKLLTRDAMKQRGKTDNTTPNERYTYHVHFRKASPQQCSYDPIMISGAA
ncbi:MAG TPA: hypothetical protein VFJ62_15460 [Usitatibacter sp.]|nr:hypothetical protein [Usitatibacter sp.]